MTKFKIKVKHPNMKSPEIRELSFAGLKYFDFEGHYALSFVVDGYDEFYSHECYNLKFDYNTFQSTGKLDINGNEIYYDHDIVKFKLFYGGDWIELVGIFRFNSDELRAEIDINDHPQNLICLWYDISTMKDFEIINLQKDGE